MALWSVVILRLSGDDWAAASTFELLRPLLAWLLPDTGAHGLEALHFALRKVAHVVEYAVLGGLALWAFGRTPRVGRLAAAGLALALVASVATLDEWHQGRSPARTGSRADVGLDLAGGLLAIGLGSLWSLRRARPKPKRETRA